MSKHTPGPWILHMGTRNVYGTVNDRTELIAQVCDMPCVGGHDDLAAERGMDMERANARLIAAAPDLLETLRMIIGTGCIECMTPDHKPCECEIARAVIAKATGADHE